MLIYLSCEGEPRQILNQLEVSEMQEPGGLGRVLRLLEDSYGARADERFEEKQEAYLSYRRAPGQSIAAYVSTLSRMRTEYLKEDPDTTTSDKAYAQRLLSSLQLAGSMIPKACDSGVRTYTPKKRGSRISLAVQVEVGS